MPKVKVACDYSSFNGGYHLKDGRFQVYGDFPCPGPVLECPFCHGTLIREITLKEANERLDRAVQRLESTQKEIKTLEKAIENAVP